MKAYIVKSAGGPEVLRLEEVPNPVAGEGEVRIAVKAIGINRLDLYVRSGAWGRIDQPRQLGIEAVGEVIEDKTGTFAPGTRVATMMGGLMLERPGTYAEQIVVSASHVVRLGDAALGWETLGSLPEAFLTVWAGFHKAIRPKAGEEILIRGAASSVGLAATVYAKWLGLRVIATTRNAQKRQLLLEKGADECLIDDGRLRDLLVSPLRPGVDAALEIIGASTLRDTIQSVKHFGSLAILGLLGGREIERFDVYADLQNGVSVSYVSSEHIGSPYLPIKDFPLAHIAQAIADEKMPSILDKVFTFDALAHAHEYAESNQSFGKIVVVL
ncbi:MULTISPECIES: zinc-binding dehydrogenase [unclassified Pseudomonas]|uniref:zinc-binding dehydrogenase n=1 Tax=unclassified Pseudomonas TaxID=196821 RepID=UPI000C2FC320|nr:MULTISPECIES: zinc-binding dehydrogenase [unclassified Pseudomonas]MCU1737983.1 zinc-binding dehydrogenase [Pseudomonas sp. 20S_6.2_Bac1]